jgi:hypothetical protein
LETTVDAALPAIGQRTRSNLRYYRRRAETRLGCTFLPEIKVLRAEVLTFNRQCMYADGDDVGLAVRLAAESVRPVATGDQGQRRPLADVKT